MLGIAMICFSIQKNINTKKISNTYNIRNNIISRASLKIKNVHNRRKKDRTKTNSGSRKQIVPQVAATPRLQKGFDSSKEIQCTKKWLGVAVIHSTMQKTSQVNLLSFCERIYSSKTGQKNLHIECKDVSTWPLCDVLPLVLPFGAPYYSLDFTRIEFWPSSREQCTTVGVLLLDHRGGTGVKHVDARPSRDFIRGIRQEEENPTRRVNRRAESTLRLGA
jgi:hypothetical protein